MTKNTTIWFPSFSEEHLSKDTGQIARHLAAIGYHVRILAYQNERSKDVPAVSNVQVLRVKRGGKTLRVIGFPLHYYILKNRKCCDCLILYFAGLTTAIASALFKILNRRGICIVKLDSNGRLYSASSFHIKVNSREGTFEGSAYKRNLFERMLYRLIGELAFRIYSVTVDILVIESPEARERLLKIHPGLERKLIVLPNGIDQAEFAELSKSIRIDRKNSILFVGRVEYAKGVDILIGAFSKLKHKYPHWTLELVGVISPSFRDQIQSLIPDDLKDRVILAGPLYGKQLAEKYLGSKIFCFTSRAESFGIALVEAIYFGNAVISSDVGAARYILDYGNAGLIYNSENLEQLAAGLDKLMSDQNLRDRLTKAAKARCEKLFDWEKIVGDLDSHIANVLARRRRSSME